MRNKARAIKGLAEEFCCPLNQSFPMSTGIRIIGEPVKNADFDSADSGQDLRFCISGKVPEEARAHLRSKALLLSSQDYYVTVFTHLPGLPPDGSMSIFSGSCC